MKEIKNAVADFLTTKHIILILPVCILIFRILFSERRASAFDFVSLLLLLLCSFYSHGKTPRRKIPGFLIVSVLLYMLSDFIAALLSKNPYWELKELRKYVFVFIAGLLFTTPREEKTQNLFIIVFYIATAVAGLHGIWQYFKMGIRSHGCFYDAIMYSETLALVCGAPVLMFFIHDDKKTKNNIFLLIVSVCTLSGILFSLTRGVWLALVMATVITFFLYDRRKASFFSLAVMAVLSLIFYLNVNIRDRAASIVTSVYTEDEKGSTGARLELWKGALLMFKESPVWGAGTGNFQPIIKRLVLEKKIRETPIIGHAHNIFLQTLATKGIVGFAILIVLFASLLKWGMKEIKNHGGSVGYIIIFSTIFTMLAGLTEDSLQGTKYFASFCFLIGLMGGSEQKESESVILPNKNSSL